MIVASFMHNLSNAVRWCSSRCPVVQKEVSFDFDGLSGMIQGCAYMDPTQPVVLLFVASTSVDFVFCF